MLDSRCAHIIYTPMTGVGLHGGYRGDSWFKHRIEIFKNYTLRSLQNQTNKNFIHWISFRKEETDNLLISQLAGYLDSINYPYIFTFDGLMYHDDKFTNYNFKTGLRNLLMMIWDCWNQKELRSPSELLRNSWENKNETLLKRVSSSLSRLKNRIGSNYNWIYLTRIDSDDMLNKDAIELIQSQTPEENKALIFDKGYIYNVQTNQLGEWNPPTNPPFHTIIFPGDVFFNPKKYLEYYKDFKTHEDIPKVFNSIYLDNNNFMVSAHGKQISTAWDRPLIQRIHDSNKYKGYMYTTSGKNISTYWQSKTRKVKNFMIGKEFKGREKEKILSQFGIT